MEPHEKISHKEVEKRAVKARSRAGLFKDAKIAVLKEETLQGKVNLFLFKKLITITDSVSFITKIPKNVKGYDFVFTPETSDQKAENLLKSMLNSEKFSILPNCVRLLGESTMKDIEKYAKEKNIIFPNPKKKSCEQAIINEIEEKYPGTVRSLAKSSDTLGNFLVYR